MPDTKAFADSDPDPDSLPVLTPGMFVFVRHGQTHWNAERRMQGHSNGPGNRLTAEGFQQARKAATILKDAGVKHLVCSGLYRAQQTLDEIWQMTGGTIRMDEALNERCFGKLEKMTMPEVVVAVGVKSEEDFEDNFHHYLPPCAESNKALLQRVVPAINNWRDLYKGEPVAFVGHGGCYRVLREHLTGVRARSKNGVPFRFACHNDALCWTIDEMGRDG